MSADLAASYAAWPDYMTIKPTPKAGVSAATSYSATSVAAYPTSKTLYVDQYPEQNPSTYCGAGVSCYCGPSAVQSILHFLNYLDVSNDKQDHLSQSCLAGTCGSGKPYSTKYLETNKWGNTPWYVTASDRPVPMSINYWMTSSYSGYYLSYKPTSLLDYEGALEYDINGNYPFAGDVEEIAGSTHVHLPGHPSQLEIQHWIAIFGYDTSGAGTDYADPVAGSALGWNAQAYNYGYSSTNIYTLVTDASTKHGPFGIAY